MLEKTKRLVAALFKGGEVKQRIAANTVKTILADMDSLYQEYKKYKGPGALFFNPANDKQNNYLTVDDIKNDLCKAEEYEDTSIKEFLSSVIRAVEKVDDGNSVLVLVEPPRLTINILDISKVDEQVDALLKEANSCP